MRTDTYGAGVARSWRDLTLVRYTIMGFDI